MDKNTTEATKEFIEAWQNENKIIKNEILPVVKEIVQELRDHRMTIQREMKEIQFSVGSFHDLAKKTEQIERFTKAVFDLAETLKRMPPDIKVKLEDLFR